MEACPKGQVKLLNQQAYDSIFLKETIELCLTYKFWLTLLCLSVLVAV